MAARWFWISSNDQAGRHMWWAMMSLAALRSLGRKYARHMRVTAVDALNIDDSLAVDRMSWVAAVAANPWSCP
jgi:hypothetical protein